MKPSEIRTLKAGDVISITRTIVTQETVQSNGGQYSVITKEGHFYEDKEAHLAYTGRPSDYEAAVDIKLVRKAEITGWPPQAGDVWIAGKTGNQIHVLSGKYSTGGLLYFTDDSDYKSLKYLEDNNPELAYRKKGK